MTLADLTEEELLVLADELQEHLAEMEGLVTSRGPGARAHPHEAAAIRITRSRVRAVNAELNSRAPGLYDLGGAPS